MNTKKPGRGRPPKSAEDRRTDELRIRLTEAERKELDQAAAEQDTSTWARDVLLKSARRKPTSG